jgi:hypothetical protein
LAVGIEVIRAIEVDWVDVAAGDKHLQVDDLGTLHVERLQLVRRERYELAALILVSPDDVLFLDFLAGARIVRPERDPSCRANSFRLILDVIRSKPRRHSVGTTVCSLLVRYIAYFVARS